MNMTGRIVVFGTASGLLWSLVPGFITELFESPKSIAVVLLVGVLTGVLVSYALYRPLLRRGRWVAFWLGLLSLPTGAFCFGVLLSIAYLLLGCVTGEPDRFLSTGFHPIAAGMQYAAYSVISILGIFLPPLAVLSTFLLRSALRGGTNRSVEST